MASDFPCGQSLSSVLYSENPPRNLSWGDLRLDSYIHQPIQSQVQSVTCSSQCTYPCMQAAWSISPSNPSLVLPIVNCSLVGEFPMFPYQAQNARQLLAFFSQQCNTSLGTRQPRQLPATEESSVFSDDFNGEYF